MDSTVQNGQFDVVFNQYHKFIMKLVWQLAKKGHYDFDELLSEAYLSMYKAWQEYDPTQSAMITWFHRVVWQDLLDYVRANKRYGKLVRKYAGRTKHTQGPHAGKGLALTEISEDAQMVASVALTKAEETNHHYLTRSYGKIKREVARSLRGVGWSINRIMESFQELHDLSINP